MPDCCGPSRLCWGVASDPTVSRLIVTLAAVGNEALTTIRSARAEVRQVIVDVDGVLGSGPLRKAGRGRPGRSRLDITF
jgi:hypothetical protein